MSQLPNPGMAVAHFATVTFPLGQVCANEPTYAARVVWLIG